MSPLLNVSSGPNVLFGISSMNDNHWLFIDVCMSQMMGTPNVQTYITYTDKAFSSKYIDDPANLADDKVFLFSGSVDSTVKVSQWNLCQPSP
jgi:hypothetical protein